MYIYGEEICLYEQLPASAPFKLKCPAENYLNWTPRVLLFMIVLRLWFEAL